MPDLFAHLPIKPRNSEQALALALVLGVTASDSVQAADCIRCADQIASDLHPAEVESIRDVVEICLNVLPSPSDL